MKISKIKSSLRKAINAESYLYRARCQLLQECQNCCEDKLDDCEYQPSDGFCVTYATEYFDCNQISVTTFIVKWQEKCHIFSVAYELTEIRNACGEPRSSVKQENELTSAS